MDPFKNFMMTSAAPTEQPNVAIVTPIPPLGLRLADAVTVSGISKIGLYRAASRGDIIFLKYGDTTIVDYQSSEGSPRELTARRNPRR